MPAHSRVRHLPDPPANEIHVMREVVPAVVHLWYALAGGFWLLEGCEILASTERGEMLIRYRCSDDNHLYDGWVVADVVQVMGRVDRPTEAG